jgi:polyribonucleotide nucleotidyltransferase
MSTSSLATRKPVTVERTIGDKTVIIETGRLAKQASGAVVVRLGDTMTLVATVVAPGREGLDFFPLTVDYRENVYAAGKFPGGIIKREGRPSTKEIPHLSPHRPDPSRPLFPPQYRNEVPDPAGPDLGGRPQNDPDELSIVGASASLILAENLPFMGPIGRGPSGTDRRPARPVPHGRGDAEATSTGRRASTHRARRL